MTSPNLLLILLISLTFLIRDVFSTCATKLNHTKTGRCITYPSQGLCAPDYAGRSVWLANDTDLKLAESLVRVTAELLFKNKDLIPQDCLVATGPFLCARTYPNCMQINDEFLPQLNCQADCESYWAKCQDPFNLYFAEVVLNSHVIPIDQVSLVHCGAGTFTIPSYNQPTDIFGAREVPSTPTWMEGYTGTERYPVSFGNFLLQNGSSVAIPCTPVQSLSFEFDIAFTCAYPLVKTTFNGSERCEIPCPLPVIPQEDLSVIGWAFVGPAFLALAFCTFIFLDSLWVIFETTGGGVYDFARKYLGRGTFQSNGNESTDSAVVSSHPQKSGMGNRSKTSQLRVSTLYSLTAGILGILYFLVGPLMTLLRRENVSCGTNTVYPLNSILSEGFDPTDTYCEVQRVSPFVLQAIFNLILYATVRVLLVVSDKHRNMSKMKKRLLEIPLVTYCVFGPMITCGIALGLDQLTNDVSLVFGQLARSSAICTVRLTAAQEIILIFVPYIITGLLVTYLSLYIHRHLQTIQRNVQDLKSDPNGKRTSSDIALRLLMLRLSSLGVATFIVLLILIGTTGYIMNAMSIFSPLFNAWFGCETTTNGCSSSVTSCPDLQKLADAATPAFGVFAVQIAAMSCISLLVGGFFAAQSASRLYREILDGSLQLKLENIWEGRPLDYKPPVEPKANGGPSDRGNTSSPVVRKNLKGSIIHEDPSVAAFMLAPFDGESEQMNYSVSDNPVYKNEQKHTSKVIQEE